MLRPGKLWPNIAFDIYPDQVDLMQVADPARGGGDGRCDALIIGAGHNGLVCAARRIA